MATYVEVAVDRPRPAGATATVGPGLVLSYRRPADLTVQPGHLVLVPLGGRITAGIVLGTGDHAPVAEARVLELLRLVDPEPVLTPDQLDLGRWIAAYYHCSLYQALALMLPPGVSSHEVVTLQLTPAARALDRAARDRLTARQRALLRVLDEAGGVLTGPAVRTRLGGADAGAVARQLEKRGLLERRASLLRPRVAPHHELFVRRVLPDAADPPPAARLGSVQHATLQWLIAPPAGNGAEPPGDGWRPARALYRAVAGASRQTLATLAGHGLVAVEDRAVWRDPLAGLRPPPYEPLLLTPRQGQVWEALAAALQARRPPAPAGPATCFLLHGVTGSGKTEVYLRMIGLAMRLGIQAIVLVPEIALTPQTMHRFAGRFPGRVALLHSGLSAGERYDQWRQIRDGRFDVVVGSRSAVFAPLPRLGLLILDEEHEWSYKQEGLPYYHARDVALRRAALAGAIVVLGSATPDVATYHRATRPPAAGEPVGGVDWRLLSLPARVGLARAPDGGELTTELPMPPVRLVDMRQELRGGNRSIFSLALQQALAATLRAGEQTILFLNRRGSRTFIICRACGYVPSCTSCEIPLVYHADIDLLVCHRCDTRKRQPHPCPRCGSADIKRFGAGTQRVEEEMHSLFPAARVLRWDRDTAARKGAHDSLLGAFMRQEADVLVGTQMIAKGLDLPLVTLVGVISADTGLHLPDFRAGEHTFQLLTQVAGRAGRRTAGGQVIVQTYSLEHYAIQAAARHDYRSFYTQDLRFRLTHNYPPFSRMAKLVYSAYAEAACQIETARFATEIRALAQRLGLDETVEVLGPAPAFVHKLRNRYRWQLLLRAPDLSPVLQHLALPPDWVLDVDPVSML
ncbi:MAG TPA: primosomal protein N' [Chloroflexia bacterium]|nr:primosomal protein N' [Chloroflexia bacterium]